LIKQAVILAGGKGTRLESLNFGVPKILSDINGRKLLDIQLEELKKSK
jgi:choline kinase